MSDDLISRQAAIEAVGYYSLHSGDKLLFADNALKDLPSAEVTLCHLDSPCEYQNADIAMPSAERAGKWIKDKERGKGHIVPIFSCSNCNEMEAWGWDEVKVYRYCPNCGARMKGEEE